MRVRCVADKLSADQKGQLGPEFLNQEFHLKLGHEYLVYGLQLRYGGRGGIGPWIEYETELGYLGFAPVSLFEITDPRVSRFWEITVAPDGTVLLEPPSFGREYYFDDLSSGEQSALRDFEEVKRTLSTE